MLYQEIFPLIEQSTSRNSIILAIDNITSENVIMKICTNKGRQQLENEKKILKYLGRHPSIIEIIQYLENSILMPYYPKGDLFDIFSESNKGPMEQYKSISYIKQIATALNYCHSMGVSHGDIKMENILIAADGSTRLCDFGFASFFHTLDDHIAMSGGTQEYFAPENFTNQKTPRTDYWAFGILVFELLVGKYPFSPDDHIRYKYSIPAYVHDMASKLIHGLLQHEPKMRYSFDDVLNHPYLTNEDHDY